MAEEKGAKYQPVVVVDKNVGTLRQFTKPGEKYASVIEDALWRSCHEHLMAPKDEALLAGREAAKKMGDPLMIIDQGQIRRVAKERQKGEKT